MSEMYTENVLEALHPLIYVDFFTWWEFIICILSWGRSIINENFQSYGQKIQSLAKNNTVFKFAFAFTVCLWGEEMWGGRFCVCPTSPHPLDAGLRNLYSMIRLLVSHKWRISRITAIPQASIPVGDWFFLIVLTGPPTPYYGWMGYAIPHAMSWEMSTFIQVFFVNLFSLL